MGQTSEQFPDGTAIVYCEGAFDSSYGKTAHGLVRLSRRYRVAAVIDARFAGEDAGAVLDGAANGIPMVADLAAGFAAAEGSGEHPTHLVVGVAPDGGVLDANARAAVLDAIDQGLAIDSGLHVFLADDAEIGGAAFDNGVKIRDVRRPPPREELHFFSGKINEVDSTVIAVLGTDSAVGKRTTAWKLVDALNEVGISAELIGTGQTAWMQGVRYGIMLDSLVNDFVAGELEHVVWQAWSDQRPQVIVVEGQGSLMHPAYPSGLEILAATRPAVVILQHAPVRPAYEGFKEFPLHPLQTHIEAVELLSGKPVIAVTLNHEGLTPDGLEQARKALAGLTGLPVVDPLTDSAATLVEAIRPHLK